MVTAMIGFDAGRNSGLTPGDFKAMMEHQLNTITQ